MRDHVGRSDRRARGHKRSDRGRELELEDDLGADDRAEPAARRSLPDREQPKADPDAWRREFVRKYKPKGEKRPKEFDYANPKKTEGDAD